MRKFKIGLAGVAAAGALGLAALGSGAGVAMAAPPGAGVPFMEHPGNGHGHDRWDDWNRPYWGPPPPPPPPPPIYYGRPSVCGTGPLGYVQVCI